MSIEHGIFLREQTLRPEYSKDIQRLRTFAIPDGLSRLSKHAEPGARERVINGLTNTFLPYVNEISILADQKESEEYQRSGERVHTYRGVRVAASVCPDRRIGYSAVALSQDVLHRLPRGVPEFRVTSVNPDETTYVNKNPTIAAAIEYAAELQKEQGKKLKGYEKLVAHTNCAAGAEATKKKARDEKRPEPEGEELEMQSIEGFFDTVFEPMSGFNTDIERAGGVGLTVISLFDIHSQGEIFGLEHVYAEKRAQGEKLFDRSKSIHENFKEMEKNGQILMPETVDKKILQDNTNLVEISRAIRAGKRKPIDVIDPNFHAKSMIAIADMTKEVTQRYEESKDGFTWIPEKIRESIKDKDPDLLRALAFDMIRNSVRRILADIEPGNHNRLKHPERLTRVGSIGGALNEQTPAFVISTPGGLLREQDLEYAKLIIPLQAKVAKELGVNEEEEAHIVVVTEEFDAGDYNPKNPLLAKKARITASAIAKSNAADIRELFPEEVANGKLVVVAALHDHSRRMTDILTSLPADQLGDNV